MNDDLYSQAVVQALQALELVRTETSKRNKKRAKGMEHFGDALARSAAHGEARPTLRTKQTKSIHYLQGWNMAYGVTYPFLAHYL